MNEIIFNYCERGLDPSFLAEPLNAFTNAAFVLAGYFIFVLLQRQTEEHRRPSYYILAWLMATIGVGSFLFHTFATRWAALADTLPIAVFMFVYLYGALRRLVDLSRLWSMITLIVFAIAFYQAGSIQCGELSAPCLNGSLMYVPALVMIGILGGWLTRRADESAKGMYVAAGIFLVSLTFRTLDGYKCEQTIFFGYQFGTHFLWHLLNATVLYLLMRTLIVHRHKHS